MTVADAVEILRSKPLEGIPHGFLGRGGGISTGIYEGLNVGIGSDDDPAAIMDNRRRAATAIMPGAVLARIHQVHSPDVVIIDDKSDIADPPKADAMVTRKSGILLGILTADCVPVLFADPQAGVIGAAHAGWKGALTGVTDNVITAMEALGASRDRIACAVGPCIAQRSYEVDDGFFRRFAEADPHNERFFSHGSPGHFQFDIEGYVAARLAAAGIGKVECLGEDTYGQPQRFFSYRRSCHVGEADYGRQISLIGLKP
ncbi:MAG: peptidoglycan editing factor PgeF [Sphingorhabdus sp.]